VKQKEIRDYTELERAKGRQIASSLLTADFTIRDSLALFPEYDLDSTCGLHRPGVNLGALLFLFPKVVTYVPAIPRQEFVHRFGVDFETFLYLSDPALGAHRFVFPVLDHPDRYSGKHIRNQLSPLLDRYDPTWERWHEALRHSGGDTWFALCDSLVNYRKVLSQKNIWAAWASDHPGKSDRFIALDIRRQIRNRFTDLCLVEKEDLAREVAEWSHSDPYRFVLELSYCSALFAYPRVLGAGGNPNFVTTDRGKYLEMATSTAESEEQLQRIFDGEIVKTLLEGFRFHEVPKVFALDFLAQWHTSGQAQVVRGAYSKLLAMARSDSVGLDEFQATVKLIASSLREFSHSAYADPAYTGKKVEERQTRAAIVCTVGGLLMALVGLVCPAVAVQAFVESALVSLLSFIPLAARERVESALIQRHLPNLPVDLVHDCRQVRQFRRDFVTRALDSNELLIDKALAAGLDIPAGTLWLSDT